MPPTASQADLGVGAPPSRPGKAPALPSGPARWSPFSAGTRAGGGLTRSTTL